MESRNFDLKTKIYHLIIALHLMINFVYGRDFSGNLLREYQEIVNRKIEAGASKSIACANLDILILLMPEASKFDLTTMQVIGGNFNLFVDDNFYQEWKQRLIGRTFAKDTENEISKLERLERIKLIDIQESRDQWTKLIKKTEIIINKIGKLNGYKLILNQNTITKPYSFQKLKRFAVVYRNITNITPIIAKYILEKQGLSLESSKKIIQSIEQDFIF